MEGPKRIYLFPGIATGYESRTFPDEIEYTRADLVRELVEAAQRGIEDLQWCIDFYHLSSNGQLATTVNKLKSALAALKAMEES